MESGTTNPSRGSSTTNTRKQRCKVLHSCGVSFLTLASKAYNRVEHVQGPIIGFLTRKITKFGHPILSTVQHQWLSILSYADDQILAIETLVETIFPPATHVFKKMDTLVQVSSEALPEKFDKAMDLLSSIIHQRFPILCFASTQFIAVLNFFITTLTDWSNDEAKEKEIVIDIDINCNEFLEGPPKEPIHDDIEDENSSPNIDRIKDKEVLKDGEGKEQIRDNSCKDILEMKKEESGNGEEEMKNSCYKDIEEMEKKEDIMIIEEEKALEDPIVELFANGWYS